MNDEMNIVWQELYADMSTTMVVWQLGVIVVSLLLAWSINGILRAYVMQRAPENWKVGISSINRVLFPLSSLLFVFIGKLVLGHWQHTSLLKLAITLLIAMAVIRLVVYALRYIFAPTGWVRTMESAISTTVWLLLALYLSGLLPQLLQALDDISFSVGKHPITLLLIIQALLTILITLFIALWASRIIENKLMRAEHINMNMRVVLGKLIRIFLSFVAILIALSAVGLDITLLSVFGGALGVGLGFGLQKIASNYVSGFIILLDESVHMGDVITVDNHYGVVSDLRSRYMVLRKLDGTEVLIPNEGLITNAVINHSFSDRNARVQMPVQVSYDGDLELAMKLMLDIAVHHPRVLSDPAPAVLIKGFGENGIDLNLIIWIPDPEEGSSALQSSIFLEIWREFQKHSISIPYPQREVRMLGNIDKEAKPAVSD
ncbi:MAG TPA: mechanosensitive ion channel domain-containing protein [Methylophilaceae bacterium]|jgi:small-conductance mechanosensitive channel